MLVATPGAIRLALRSPLRAAILETLGDESRAGIADERLRRVRAQMAAGELSGAERLLLELVGQRSLAADQEFEARSQLGDVLFEVGRADEAKAG